MGYDKKCLGTIGMYLQVTTGSWNSLTDKLEEDTVKNHQAAYSVAGVDENVRLFNVIS